MLKFILLPLLLLEILVIIESYNVISLELNLTMPTYMREWSDKFLPFLDVYFHVKLAHFTPMSHFYIPWKSQKWDIGVKGFKLLVLEKLTVKESYTQLTENILGYRLKIIILLDIDFA